MTCTAGFKDQSLNPSSLQKQHAGHRKRNGKQDKEAKVIRGGVYHPAEAILVMMLLQGMALLEKAWNLTGKGSFFG